MDSILLRAKLQRPVTPATVVPRPALLRRLERGLPGKVTLVSAPTGFGKSTIVSGWLDRIESEAATPDGAERLKTCWLSLEEVDNQLPHFVRYLAAAIEAIYPQSCAALLELLHDKEAATIETLADVLANALTLLPGRLVVVLDDLHRIDDPAVYAFLTRLIQHTSNRLHLVLVTRVDPPLPLNRWRAAGQLNELRHRDLNFTLAETTTFLQNNLEWLPDDATIASLHERTEGWVVGLRLVMLALRNQSDYARFAANVTAANSRYIADYLVDEVLEQQPGATQTFLICTAILTRFCAELGAAVVEIDVASAQQQIDAVARANLFLISLSSPPRWYRYHHQFQSMLLSRLHERYSPQAIAVLHRQAAEWLAAHGQVGEALRHLTTIADFEAVADLIASQRVAALNEHRFHELEEWLALLPPHLLSQDPTLLLGLAWVQDHRLEFSQCLTTVQRAEERLHEQSTTLPVVTQKLLQAEIVALRTSVDESLGEDRALALIQGAWTELRPYLTYTHCIAVVWLSHSCYRLGGGERAGEILLTAFEMTGEWPPMARSRLLYSAGILYWYNCNLARAERLFQQGLELARRHDLHLAATLCHFGLGVVASSCNQHELAETYHLAVVKEPHYQNGLRAVLSAYCLIGIYAQRGEPGEGRRLVDQLKAHAAMLGRPYLINQVGALEAYADLCFGEQAAPLRWALAGSHGAIYSSADRIPLIRAQVLLAEGSPASLELAGQLLAALSGRHQSERAWIFWIDTTVLQALVWAKLGQVELALALLGRAVQRGVPNGVVKSFFAAGPALEPLLYELRKQPEYAQQVQLLGAALPSRRTARIAAASPALPEPLTERERDILQLLAARLSNSEIAQQLIVSVHTVRNHTANLYSKLGVASRREAVAKAYDLGLLVE
jgi:LuxR family maltose regulon positive regulatory protein